MNLDLLTIFYQLPAFIIRSPSEYPLHGIQARRGGNRMYTTAKLINVEDDLPITRDTYADFFYEFQLGVLLSLKADGCLTQMQYRNAEEALKEQRRAILPAKTEGGSTS